MSNKFMVSMTEFGNEESALPGYAAVHDHSLRPPTHHAAGGPQETSAVLHFINQLAFILSQAGVYISVRKPFPFLVWKVLKSIVFPSHNALIHSSCTLFVFVCLFCVYWTFSATIFRFFSSFLFCFAHFPPCFFPLLVYFLSNGSAGVGRIFQNARLQCCGSEMIFLWIRLYRYFFNIRLTIRHAFRIHVRRPIFIFLSSENSLSTPED